MKDVINLNKGQKIMTEMFKIFTDLCKTNNIKYWAHSRYLNRYRKT